MLRILFTTLIIFTSELAVASKCPYELAFYNIAIEPRNLKLFSHHEPKALPKVNGLLQKPLYHRDFSLSLASQEEKNLPIALNCDAKIVLLVVTDVDHNTQRVIRHEIGETIIIF